MTLTAGSLHTIEVQAAVHSTAFLQWTYKATAKNSHVRLKATYSESYELEPRNYPFFRTKADRLDAENGHLIGPYDEVTLDLPQAQTVIYEPFWFRTFRIIRLEITVGPEPIQLLSFNAIQVNYPLAVKASWKELEMSTASKFGTSLSEQCETVCLMVIQTALFTNNFSECPPV